MGNITLGKSNQMNFEVEVNFPEQVEMMSKCIEDAKKLVNKELIIFGRESEISDGDICYCVSILAAGIFRKVCKMRFNSNRPPNAESFIKEKND